MSEPFIAEVRIFAGNFAPRNWAFCDGQLLPIAQNTALFSIVGTTFGGDGRTTLGLPNLQGRAAMHPGRGPGLTSRRLGESGGVENVTLTTQQIPSHEHSVNASSDVATLASPIDKSFADTDTVNHYGPKADEENFAAVSNVGSSRPHNVMQPYIAMNYIIALQGTYPSRS